MNSPPQDHDTIAADDALPTLMDVIDAAPMRLTQVDKEAILLALVSQLSPKIDAVIAAELDKTFDKLQQQISKALRKTVLQSLQAEAEKLMK